LYNQAQSSKTKKEFSDKMILLKSDTTQDKEKSKMIINGTASPKKEEAQSYRYKYQTH